MLHYKRLEFISVARRLKRCRCTPRAKMKLTKFISSTCVFSALSCPNIRLRRWGNLQRFPDLSWWGKSSLLPLQNLTRYYFGIDVWHFESPVLYEPLPNNNFWLRLWLDFIDLVICSLTLMSRLLAY